MGEPNKLFAALLKYWRGRRGFSQLDLALTAGVSARHVSFLETGRSAPSVEMVMLLGATLDLSLRDRNDFLRAGGFEAEYEEPAFDALDDPVIERVINRMLRQQEPFPMLLMDGCYDVLRMNESATRFIKLIIGEVPKPLNAIRTLFEPPEFRAVTVDWEESVRELVSRLQRECLHRPQDARLAALLAETLDRPEVPDEWRRPDFSRGSDAAFTFRFRLQGIDLAFLTTIMTFHAPQNVTLDELQIESWFPLDEATEQACSMLASAVG